MTRRLLNLLTALSLLLCVVVLAVAATSYGEWGRSVRVGRSWLGQTTARGDAVTLHAHNGQFAVIISREKHAGIPPSVVDRWRADGQKTGWSATWHRRVQEAGRGATLWDRIGFTRYERRSLSKYGGPNQTQDTARNYYGLPFWIVAAGMAALPFARARSCVRRWRCRLSGHCPACGYDLRATPGRCPECGTPATTPT